MPCLKTPTPEDGKLNFVIVIMSYDIYQKGRVIQNLIPESHL